jgi:hypothetical protein
MRIRPTDRVFAVVDPTEHSELADCVFETTLSQLHTLVDQRREVYAAATLHDTEEAATEDGERRLLAARVARGILASGVRVADVSVVELRDSEGHVQAEIEVRPCS